MEQELRVELTVTASARAAREALAAVDAGVAAGALVGIAPPAVGTAVFGGESFLAIRWAAQLLGQRPECRRVIGMHQMCHFMPERDEGLVPAVVEKRLPGHDNTPLLGLAVAPVLLARRDQKLAQAQCAYEVRLIQPMELLPQRGFYFVTFGHLLALLYRVGSDTLLKGSFWGLPFFLPRSYPDLAGEDSR